MTPQTKKLLSTFGVAIAGAALTSVQQALSNPPFTPRSLLVAGVTGALAGLVHYLPAFGTKDEVAAKVDAQVSAKVAEVIGKEST